MATKLSQQDGMSVPVPDPTTLTTQQLVREIFSLKELIFTRLDGMDEAIKIFNAAITRTPTDTDKQIGQLKELLNSKIECADHEGGLIRSVIETRLDGMDRALELLQSTADKFPARIDEKIGSLEKVHEEKFKSIETQFRERDVRTEQATTSTKTAVDAALAAQEKAVGKQNDTFAISTQKSEEGFTKQIDQLVELFQTTTRGLEGKIEDLKDRFNRQQGTGEGKALAQTTQQTSSSFIVAMVGVIFAVIIGATGIIIGLVK